MAPPTQSQSVTLTGFFIVGTWQVGVNTGAGIGRMPGSGSGAASQSPHADPNPASVSQITS